MRASMWFVSFQVCITSIRAQYLSFFSRSQSRWDGEERCGLGELQKSERDRIWCGAHRLSWTDLPRIAVGGSTSRFRTSLSWFFCDTRLAKPSIMSGTIRCNRECIFWGHLGRLAHTASAQSLAAGTVQEIDNVVGFVG
jgi:hypothetical protein